MTNTRTKLTTLKAAIEHIAHDNGAVNHYRTIAEVRQNAYYALRMRYTLAQLDEVEVDLAVLSPALLEEVCIGEMPEPMPIKPLTHAALNCIFDSLS